MFITSCSSTPKVDWNSRVGNYTYDQAVVELGPTSRTATLTGGKMVVDLVVGVKQHSSVSFGSSVFGGGYHSAGGVGVGETVGGGYSDKILRLTFGTDNRLVTWWKNY